MKKMLLCLAASAFATGPALASYPWPLEDLLRRAKFVFIAEASPLDGGKVTLKVKTRLHGDFPADTLSLKFLDPAGPKPEVGRRYFVFSQGLGRGEPRNVVALKQAFSGQGGHSGWIMHPIEKRGEVEIVRYAFSYKFGKVKDEPTPVTLPQAQELVK